MPINLSRLWKQRSHGNGECLRIGLEGLRLRCRTDAYKNTLATLIQICRNPKLASLFYIIQVYLQTVALFSHLHILPSIDAGRPDTPFVNIEFRNHSACF